MSMCWIIVDILDICEEYVYYQITTGKRFDDIETVICYFNLETCNWKGDGRIKYEVEI